MNIKSNSIKFIYIFCICFVFVFLNTSIVLDIDNGHQIAFSQGYIPAPIISFKSTPVQCPQIAFSGPVYTGPDGCIRPCPNNTNNPNINTAQVFIPECQNRAIGNQSGGTGISNPITACPNIAFSGPTYKGLDGCPRPCPTVNNNPSVANVYIPPECRNQAIGNQSGGGQYSKDNPCVSAQVYTGPTYRDQEFGCPKPCPTSGNIPQGCPPQVGIIIDNQSTNIFKSK